MSVLLFGWPVCAATLFLCSSKSVDVIHAPDIAIGLGVLVITTLPFSKLSWLALSALSFYMLWVSAEGRRAGELHQLR